MTNETLIQNVPKYRQIEDLLKKQIADGRFADSGKLPPETELAEQLGVHRLTVNRAMASLVSQGMLERKQGRGTFAVSRRPRSRDMERCVVLGVRTQGHVFADQVQVMVDRLRQHGLHAVLIDTSPSSDVGRPAAIAEQVRQMVHDGAHSLILDGGDDFLWSHLVSDDLVSAHVVFINRHDQPSRELVPHADVIASDYRQGSDLAMSHLLDRGHRRLAILSYSGTQLPEHAVPLEKRQWTYQAMIAGCRAAVERHGLNFDRDVRIVYDVPMDELPDAMDSRLVPLFGGSDAITGVFCFGDYRARRVYRAAGLAHRVIGKDLAILGYYDTPWCRWFEPPLSSMSTDPARIAELAVEAVMSKANDPNRPPVREMVPPRLMARASS
ncbi:MAG: GntR family transcriptional regulator [Phycisphaeraceae bacterium]|nr:GntR family transcriptional regulator [Phycisphaeraceae bacterium]